MSTATKTNKSALSIAQLISSNIAVKPLGIAALFFYTRYLPKEHLALLPIYEMLGALSTLIFSFGIFPTFIRSLPSRLETNREEAHAMILTGSSIVLSGVVLYSLCIFCFAEQISQLVIGDIVYSKYLRLMAIGFCAMGINQILSYLLTSASRFKQISFLNVFRSIANAISTVGLLLLLGLKGLVLGLVIRDVLCTCLSIYFVKDLLITRSPRFYSIRKLLASSLPFYGESYLNHFKNQGDYWVLNTFLGPSSLATYFVAKRLYNILFTIFKSAQNVITVGIAKKSKSEMQELIYRLFTVISQTFIPFIFFIIGLTPVLIYLIAGKTFMGAVVPSIFLNLSILFMFIMIPMGGAVLIFKQPVARLKLTIVESVILMIALLLLTPIFKENGAALSRLLSLAVTIVYVYFAVRKIINIRIPIRSTLLSLSISSVMMVFLIVSQMLCFSIYALPLYICGALLIFLISTSWLNADTFYSTLNSLLPFRVTDPVKYFLGSKLAQRLFFKDP